MRSPLVLLSAGLFFGFAAFSFAELPSVDSLPLDESPNGATSEPTSFPAVAVKLPKPRYQIEATLSAKNNTISGSVTIEFQNVTPKPLDEALLLLYPNRFEEPPAYLNEINQASHYPWEFDPGRIELSNVKVAGQEAKYTFQEGTESKKLFAKVSLPTPLGPGESTRVTASFVTKIPERYGRFGAAQGSFMLDGGFYPQLAHLTAKGYQTQTPPRPGHFQAKLSAPDFEGEQWINGQGPFPTQETSPTIGEAAYVSWILLPRHELREAFVVDPKLKEAGLVPDTTGATKIKYFYTDRLLQDRQGDWDENVPGLNTDSLRDYPKEVIEAVDDGLRFLQSLGFELKDKEIRLIEVPLREYVARASPGIILISDRTMKIFPSEKLLKFHRLQILRAVYSQLVEEQAQSFEQEEDLAWVCDAIGAYLSDLYHVKGYLKQDFAKEMLKPYSFISEIDRLRWVPQVSFKDAYFKTAYERDPFRDDVRRFLSLWPYGKFIYGKLRALFGFEKFVGLSRAYLGGEKMPFRALSERYYGQPLRWFYTQWLRPHPQINYKLVSHSSTLQEGGYQNQIVVQKEGDTWVKEPIDILVTYKNGETESLLWPLDATSHTFSWRAAQPIKSIHIDPSENTIEAIRGIPDDLKFDNRDPARWRIVWDGFDAGLSSNGLFFSTSGSARREHDRRNFYFLGSSVGGGFNAAFDDSVERLNSFGFLFAGYSRAFGIGIDEDRLTARVGANLATAVLGSSVSDKNSDSVLEFVPPAGFARLTLSAGYSNRLAFLAPWKGTNFALSLAYSVGLTGEVTPPSLNGSQMELNDNCAETGGVCQSVAITMAGAKLFSLDAGRVLGVRFTGATLLGNPLGQGFFDVGGDGNLKGYALDQVEGRSRLLGALEYRQPLWKDLDVNLAEINRLRAVHLVFWTSGATISDRNGLFDPKDRALFSEGSYFADAGVGIRLFGDHLGIDPALLSFDFATPLVGNQLFGGPFSPLQFYVGFGQNF